MALVLLGTAAALGVHASRKRSRALADREDPASGYLPETIQDKKLYDPLRRGPRWATDWLGAVCDRPTALTRPQPTEHFIFVLAGLSRSDGLSTTTGSTPC
jgi:hypothetical protein